VLVAPHWASTVSWNERKVYVDLSRRAIKNSPAWNSAAPGVAAAVLDRGWNHACVVQEGACRLFVHGWSAGAPGGRDSGTSRRATPIRLSAIP
jgi:hypothetical protein